MEADILGRHAGDARLLNLMRLQGKVSQDKVQEKVKDKVQEKFKELEQCQKAKDGWVSNGRKLHIHVLGDRYGETLNYKENNNEK